MWGPDDLFFLALEHPYKILAAVVLLYLRFLITSGNMPLVPGSKVTPIRSVSHWNQIRQEANSNGQLVAVEFYAPWVRPCHVSSPIFGRMSVEFDQSVVFVKCNLDANAEMKAEVAPTAFPTYQLWKGTEKLSEIQGWSADSEKKLQFTLDGWAKLYQMQSEHSSLGPKDKKKER